MSAAVPKSSVRDGGAERFGRSFLEHILRQIPEVEDPHTPLRQQARAQLAELGIPTPREEDWKYSDLSPLVAHTFRLAGPGEPGLEVAALEPWLWPESRYSYAVFVNGYFAPHLSNLSGLPSALRITPLSQSAPGWLQTIAKVDVFSALNTAHLGDGIQIELLPQQEVLPPLHLLWITLAPEGEAVLAQPRCLVTLQANTALTLIEDHVSGGAGIPFGNAVTEIALAEGARLHHVIFQRQGSQAFHINQTAVRQGRHSHYRLQVLQWGSQFSRHNLEIAQVEPQAHTHLQGLTLLKGSQHSDTHSRLRHQAPQGSSRQLHKCIVDETARAVFSGRILVSREAQLTDAAQTNRNLLLSPKARVDTRPQLEIFADNVKCTHGATVGQLEAEEIFYLQSRGIPLAQARQLLTYAFAAEILEGIPVAQLPSLVAQQLGPG
ncbi:Fe-S cluster assembly protein SufD [Synechococcus sp. H70.2]|uniref:Fe-S cluster assembly protein SufD n=1 Tax=Synechococcus sp. H70.2 TaxID=2964528 RepID=UPI0039C1C4E8